MMSALRLTSAMRQWSPFAPQSWLVRSLWWTVSMTCLWIISWQPNLFILFIYFRPEAVNISNPWGAVRLVTSRRMRERRRTSILRLVQLSLKWGGSDYQKRSWWYQLERTKEGPIWVVTLLGIISGAKISFWKSPNEGRHHHSFVLPVSEKK